MFLINQYMKSLSLKPPIGTLDLSTRSRVYEIDSLRKPGFSNALH